MTKKTTYIILILLLMFTSVKAQFYNGYQVRFGQNRVQYDNFYWQFYRYKKFDTYFYARGTELAVFASKVIEEKIKEYERFFEYSLNDRLIFQVYNNLSDFRQSNIGYVANADKGNIGGTTTIFLNRAFLYFEGDFKKFEEQISAAVVELYINQMLFGGSLTAKVANATLLSLPEWYTKGLIRFLSEGWNPELDDRVRDAVLSGKFDNFNNLTQEDAILAGHSIWHYIAKRYGKAVIPNIIYISRISKSAESGFSFILGTPLKFLTDEWMAYYYEQYAENDRLRTGFDKEERLLKTKIQRKYQYLKVSPVSGQIAYTSNEFGKYIIWVYNPKTGKTKSILRKAHRLKQITDYSYPIVAWHPKLNQLAYIYEEQGGIRFATYNLDTKEKSKRKVLYFLKINQFEYSKDGKNLVMTAVKDGKTDVYTYNLLANTFKNVTDDDAEEKWAKYLKNNQSIVFSSNRVADSLKAKETQETYDLFIYEPNRETLRRITNTPAENEFQVQELERLKFLYLSDKNGINNLALAQYDSTISFIDTAIHYKYFANTYQISDFKRNIHSYHYDKQAGNLMLLNHLDKKDRFWSKPFSVSTKANIPTRTPTAWKVQKDRRVVQDSLQQSVKDSLNNIKKTLEFRSDTNYIDFYNYTFDLTSLEQIEASSDKDSLRKGNENKPQKQEPKYKTLSYFTSFYKDNIVAQVDFQFLNEFYQTYTGSAVFQNPGMNINLKLGIADLFEDYRFTAAIKPGIDLSSNEFLFSLENNKKRLDKQYVFYRQTFSEPFVDYYSGKFYLLKTYSHQLQYRLRYPFNQVASVRGALSYRNDLVTWKVTNQETLEAKDVQRHWVGLKGEYVFDNAFPLGINLYQGWKIKLFAEAYVKAEKKFSDLYVTGFDLRHYQRIHRNLIWASRFAGSTSLGKNRLMYYLGSTDNWIRFSNKVPQFDESVKRNEEIDWAFQSLATNMRGFPQNVRNGSTFFVFNNEIRFPIINYFSSSPLSSSFLANLQLIGFFDVGSAWTGISPYDKQNKYNLDDHIQKPISIIIDNQKAPFVYGYGAGVRSKLLGYFVRADIAWGIDGDVRLKPIFYLSLSLDF